MTETKIMIVFIVGFVFGFVLAVFTLIRIYREKRERSLNSQRAVTKGVLSENFAPLFPDFPGEISEAKFIGKPIDYLIFKGMDQENIEEVIFVEVKSGKTNSLTKNERSLKDAIEARRVSWRLYEVNKN